MTYPWTDAADDWYAQLVDGHGRITGVARRVHDGAAVRYETWTGTAWRATDEGAGYFTGTGGVTDAEPITKAQADRLLVTFS